MSTKQGSDTTGSTMLGQQTPMPNSPDEAVLERVPNPHPDTYMLRDLRCRNSPQFAPKQASRILPA